MLPNDQPLPAPSLSQPFCTILLLHILSPRPPCRPGLQGPSKVDGGAEGTWPTTSAFKSPSAHQENLPLPLLLDVLLWQKILQTAQGERGSLSGLPKPDSPVLSSPRAKCPAKGTAGANSAPYPRKGPSGTWAQATDRRTHSRNPVLCFCSL